MRFNRWKAELLGMLGIFTPAGLVVLAAFFTVFVPQFVSLCLFMSISIMIVVVIAFEYRSWPRRPRQPP